MEGAPEDGRLAGRETVAGAHDDPDGVEEGVGTVTGAGQLFSSGVGVLELLQVLHFVLYLVLLEPIFFVPCKLTIRKLIRSETIGTIRSPHPTASRSLYDNINIKSVHISPNRACFGISDDLSCNKSLNTIEIKRAAAVTTAYIVLYL